MKRTITLNLSQAQFDDVMILLSHGVDQLDGMIENEIDEEVLEQHLALKQKGVPALLEVTRAALRD